MILQAKMPIDCDLAGTMLIQASNMLGNIPLSDLTVCCSLENRHEARKLQGQFGFELVLVPEIVLITRDTWSASFQGRTIWSRGA